MRSAIAYLVDYNYNKNDYGVLERTPNKRKVYVDVESVNAQEFFDGGRNGLRPALRFSIFAYDYKGEKVIEYNNEQYTIYRTYLKHYDQIDLYVEFKKGNEKDTDCGC